LAWVSASSIGNAGRRAAAHPICELTLIRPASGEIAYNVPFWRHDAAYWDGLAELDWLMRDVHAKRVRPIDLRVYYLLATAQAEFGGRPIIITSGYRTKATNERLRRQGVHAVCNSFHIEGKAVDIQIDGVPPAHIAGLCSTLQLGGVGVYPEFVHLDTGPPRFWRGNPLVQVAETAALPGQPLLPAAVSKAP
jgi:uncharacterized protein YcbK (DUF882 family)